MFNRFHRRAALAKHGRMLHAGNFANVGGDFNVEIGPAEPNTGVGRGGFQGQRDLVARVQPDAGAGNLTFERSLCVHSRVRLCPTQKQSRCPSEGGRAIQASPYAATLNQLSTTLHTSRLCLASHRGKGPNCVEITAGHQAFRISARKWPVAEALALATCSGVPWATTLPPPSPPSGPRSINQSADLITSRLCSITTTVLPCSTRRINTSRSFRTSSKCRPVVG